MQEPRPYQSITYGLGPKYLRHRHKAVFRNLLILVLTEDERFLCAMKNIFESGYNIKVMRHRLDAMGYLAVFNIPFLACILDFANAESSVPEMFLDLVGKANPQAFQPLDKLVWLSSFENYSTHPSIFGWTGFSMERKDLFKVEGVLDCLETVQCPLDCKPNEAEISQELLIKNKEEE